MNRNQLEELEQPTRELQRRFNAIIEPCRKELWRYCMMLTKSPWDAEDLMQETLLKAYATLGQLFQPVYPRPYLFRIASHTWIDQYRKGSRSLVGLVDEYETVVTDSGSLHAEDVIAALEILLESLPPRQVVIVLLIDVFDFKIKEVASLLSTTEATVKSALQRARNRLRTESTSKEMPKEKGTSWSRSSNRVLDDFIEAYNRRDVRGLISLMDEHISEKDAAVFQVYGRDQMEKSCLADWEKEPRSIQAQYLSLWGKTVVVVTQLDEEAHYLHSIMELAIEDGKIVKWSDYYFSKELLLQASEELRIPLDHSKNLFGI